MILIIGVSGAKVHIGAAELKGMALATIVGIGLSLLFKVISLFRKEEEVLDARTNRQSRSNEKGSPGAALLTDGIRLSCEFCGTRTAPRWRR